jgi:hypothetical protein
MVDPELTQELLRYLSPAEMRDLDGLLAGMESSRTALLRHATDVELDRLARPDARPGDLAAVLAACARRMAAGEPPWHESTAGEAACEAERRVFWDELLPAAMKSGKAIDYEALHSEARRIAAERLAVAPGRP